MRQKRLEALNAGHKLDFWGNDEPVCPHCAYIYEISDHDAWELYDEGDHEIECPSCELEFTVYTRVKHSFSTDEQEEE